MIDGEEKYMVPQPDLILPTQFFALRRHPPAQGERRLVLAILEDAINCFQTYIFASRNRNRRLFREAESWLMSENEEPFSYEHVCAILGLEPTYVRSGLQRWYEKQLARDLVSRSFRCVSLPTPSSASPPRSVANRFLSMRDNHVPQRVSQ